MQIIPMTRKAAGRPAAEDIIRRMEVTRRQWPRLNEPLTLRERQVANILAELRERNGVMPTMEEVFEQFVKIAPDAAGRTLRNSRKEFVKWLRSLERKKVLSPRQGEPSKGTSPGDYDLVPGAFVDPWTVLLRLDLPSDRLADAAEAVRGKPCPGAARRIKGLVNEALAPKAQEKPSADIAAP